MGIPALVPGRVSVECEVFAGVAGKCVPAAWVSREQGCALARWRSSWRRVGM